MQNKKNILLKGYFLGVAIFGCYFVNAQLLKTDNSLKSSVDSTVNIAAKEFMSNPDEVGLSIGIIHNGKAYTYNYGEIKKSTPKLPGVNNYYSIASISKTFASGLLAYAVLEKKINLDDDIRKYLDGNFPNLQYQGHPILVKHLVNHLSGLPFLIPDVSASFGNTSLTVTDIANLLYKHISKEDFFKGLHAMKLDTIPGTTFKYSNSAVILLGYILESIYKKPYEELLKEKILDSLDMDETKIVFTKNDWKRYVKAYDDKGNMIPENTESFQAAAGIKSTVKDMLKYIRWNISEKDEAVRLMHQRMTGIAGSSFYNGLNWQIISSGHCRVVWQEGNLPGFNCYCVNYPELNMGIVVLTNESDRYSSHRITIMINEIMKKLNANAPGLP